mmetsp:Transcript_118569/g.206507  ORF Transcript_118569/g.206507 Transcript_118569/m.206507 type:complete len:164 (+) Transcript_118569:1704-2195(+)
MTEIGAIDDKVFHQQERIFVAAKQQPKKFINAKGKPRYYKSVGLGFKTPASAITGTYVDKKCPFTGNVSIRGRLLRGVIVRGKMTRSVVVRRNYLHFQKKYQRFEKRHKNFTAHMSPCFSWSPGDEVLMGQCRPLSKTIRFNVLQVNPKSLKAAKALKEFGKF